MSETTAPTLDLHAPTAEIVAGYVSNNAVAADALPGLIHTVHQALAGLGAPAATAEAPRPEPAVPVKRSVFPDHIVCLKDGKKFKTLKRQLQNTYGMTPDQYRKRWELPSTYPMVAPAYAEHRSRLAKSLGLGRPKGSTKAEVAPAPKKGSRKAAGAAGE